MNAPRLLASTPNPIPQDGEGGQGIRRDASLEDREGGSGIREGTDLVDDSPVRPRFLFLGRYARVKGSDILLEAMAQFVEREKRGSLNLRGGGPLASQLQVWVDNWGIGNHVSVGGYADVPDAVRAIGAADAVVIPSRADGGAFSE